MRQILHYVNGFKLINECLFMCVDFEQTLSVLSDIKVESCNLR